MFTVYHSNQLDLLKQLIAALIEGQPLQNPFEQEVILVQSPGMAQWLQMELAKQFGIAANIEFPLPATFIWNLFTQVMPGIPKESAFSKDAMTWKLMWLLPKMLEQEAFAPLARYLSDDEDRRKHFQLAARVADLYDQYLVYRPEWLQIWERGEYVDGLDESQQWQAPLWVALKEYTAELKQPEWHRANLYEKFIQTLEQATECPQGLPKRVFICGIAALPPIYLDALKALGKHIDVHLMFTNPCRYYWGDIQDYAFLAKLQSRKRRHHIQRQQEISLFRDPQSASELFKPDGEQDLSNPLLASWGKLGRDHMYLLAQREPQEVHAFVDLTEDTLLTRIQRDLLELEDHSQIVDNPEHLNSSSGKRLLERGDRSISVNLCHSPQREVEVLHDRLLDLFAEDPSLTPRDVIVMVADIDSYTPFIQAVFGNAPRERYLPFAISDRSARQAHPVIQAFLTLLELPNSRFTSEHILTLLEVPALATHFGISEEGLRRLRHWVDESGIRWGLDDDNVRALDLPATGQHTWQFGLTRMLLGYAMDSRCGDWNGVLPYDESSGLIAELAGQLADLLMRLSVWRTRLSGEYRVQEWQPLCREILNEFFEQDSETEAVQVLIEQQWLKVIGYGISAEYPQAIPISILRDELTSRLDNERISQRFLAGPINFCTLMPMRSIPFKVVCLLGMNDGIYPRTIAPLGFDLMANKVQRGDRSRRDDDRYLFLEALLSAQERLYISYIGRSIQDNAPRYPSVLVSELMEYIAQSHHLPGDETLDVDSSAKRVMEYLQIQHPRVPFASENYALGSESQSYASEWLPAARRSGEAHQEFALALPLEEFSTITLDELIRFYRHPVRAFFQMRLGVNFVLEETELPDEEPFTLDNLSRYQLNSQLLNQLIDGDEAETLFRRFRSAGGLPYGAFGELYWEKQQEEMAEVAAKVREHRQAGRSIEIDYMLGGVRLTSWLQQVQDNGLVRWRPAILGAVDGMALWIEHLFYCFSGGEGESRCFGRQNSAWHFAPLSPKDAEKALLPLIEGYRQGRSCPLLLLPKTGWAWLSACFDKDSGMVDWDEQTQSKAQMKLLLAWQGDQRVMGEGSDPYIQRVMRTMDETKMREVQQWAEQYYLPIARNNLD